MNSRTPNSIRLSPITIHLTHLPHRPPFVFVRQLLRCEPGRLAECTALFARDDPMFAGHFPGNPLVPGVILTEALAQTAGIAAASGFPETERPLFLLSAIRGMKFFAAVRPEEEILLAGGKARAGRRALAVPGRGAGRRESGRGRPARAQPDAGKFFGRIGIGAGCASSLGSLELSR